VPGSEGERKPVREHHGERRVGRADLLHLERDAVVGAHHAGPVRGQLPVRLVRLGVGPGPDPADRVLLGRQTDHGAGGDQAGHPGGDADDAASPHGTLPW
jgi:hypothetical protein